MWHTTISNGAYPAVYMATRSCRLLFDVLGLL
jgi:hypothetical protein